MKKVIWFVFASLLVTFTSCQYDDSALKEDISDLKERVGTLETKVKALSETTIPGLQTIVNNLQKKVFVDKVTPTEDGYTISFSDGTTANITNGVIGHDGHSPLVGVKLEDGVYYWTIDGELVNGEDGKPLPVQGAAPQFRITDGVLEVSFDGTTWGPVSVTGNPIIVKIDRSGANCIITLSDGSTITVPVSNPFALVIDADLAGLGISANSSLAVPYSVKGAAALDNVTVDVLSSTAGISAKVNATTAIQGEIIITATDVTTGKIFVYADNNQGKTNIKSITLETGTLTGVAEVERIAADGGTIPVSVTTNIAYSINVSDGAESWIHVPAITKATHTDNLEITIDANTTAAYRYGTVALVNTATGEAIETWDIVQDPVAGEPVDIASIRKLPDGEAVSATGIVSAASKKGALIIDANGAYLYVTTATPVAIGDEINFAGVKKTDEQTNLVYVETTTVEVASSDNEIYELDQMYIGYGENYNSIKTGTAGILSKVEDEYVLTTPYIPAIMIETPLDEAAFEALVDKPVIVEGYTNGVFVDLDEAFNFIGYYNFIANSVKGIEFTENPAWTLTYNGTISESYGGTVYEMEDILNTVTEGSQDYYAYYGITIYSEEDLAEAGSIANLAMKEALNVSDNIIFYFSRYGETIEDDARIETGSFYPDAVDYGKYIVFATGLDENGYPTGKYAYLEFEKVDPHVPALYEDFLGTMVLDGKTIWTIEEKVNGESYTVTGINGQGDYAVEAKFVDGYFHFVEQNVVAETETTAGVYLAGVFNKSSVLYPMRPDVEPSTLFTVSYLTDGSIAAEAQTGPSGYKFESFTFLSVAAGSITGNTALVSIPTEIEITKEAVVIDPLQVEYTTGDRIGRAEKEELFAKKWIVMGDLEGEEGFAGKREYLSLAQIAEAEDKADDVDLVTVSGLSLGFADGDDKIEFEWYNGYLYFLTGNTVTWLFNDTYYLRFVQYSSKYGLFKYDYYNIGVKVADGIIAFVDTDGYGVDQFALEAYSDEACTDDLGYLLMFKNMLFVDLDVYETLSNATAAIKNIDPMTLRKAAAEANIAIKAKKRGSLAPAGKEVSLTVATVPAASDKEHRTTQRTRAELVK